MRLNTTYLAVAAAIVTGCATSSVVNQNRDPVMLMVMNNGSAIRYEKDVRVISAPVPGTPVTMWPALNAEYMKLGLPVTERDSTVHALAAQNAQFDGRFDNGQMSRIVDCGLTPLGSQRANAYKVWLTVVSQVQAASSGSVVRTSVSAQAQDPNSSTSAIQCGTTGILEAEIAAALGGNTSR